MAAVDWPDLEELKQTLDVESEDWNDQLGRSVDAAIARVKSDVGNWDDSTDYPDAALSNAALRAAVIMQANTADPQGAVDMDDIYAGHLKGHRRRFGFS